MKPLWHCYQFHVCPSDGALPSVLSAEFREEQIWEQLEMSVDVCWLFAVMGECVDFRSLVVFAKGTLLDGCCSCSSVLVPPPPHPTHTQCFSTTAPSPGEWLKTMSRYYYTIINVLIKNTQPQQHIKSICKLFIFRCSSTKCFCPLLRTSPTPWFFAKPV